MQMGKTGDRTADLQLYPSATATRLEGRECGKTGILHIASIAELVLFFVLVHVSSVDA